MMAVYRKESRSADANHRDDESEPLSPAGVTNRGFQSVVFPADAMILLFFGHGKNALGTARQHFIITSIHGWRRQRAGKRSGFNHRKPKFLGKFVQHLRLIQHRLDWQFVGWRREWIFCPLLLCVWGATVFPAVFSHRIVRRRDTCLGRCVSGLGVGRLWGIGADPMRLDNCRRR